MEWIAIGGSIVTFIVLALNKSITSLTKNLVMGLVLITFAIVLGVKQNPLWSVWSNCVLLL